jgi:hypothetical protein
MGHRRPGPGWVGGVGRIAGDPVPAHGIDQGLMQGGVDPADG